MNLKLRVRLEIFPFQVVLFVHVFVPELKKPPGFSDRCTAISPVVGSGQFIQRPVFDL